ncbi:MAG: STAS domain-containing protein [Actinobacteria bacterium]|nr:STAS domain-containing protein [Actinomycetota bacterium]
MPVRFGISDSSEHGQRIVLTVTGELDSGAVSELIDQLDRAATGGTRVVLDLSGAHASLNGTAAGLAARARRIARQDGGLTVIVRDPSLRAAFEQAGLGASVRDDQRRMVRAPAA